MTTASRFDEAVEAHDAALEEFIQGIQSHSKRSIRTRRTSPSPIPSGPPARGWDQVAATMGRAATHYEGREVLGFETIAKGVTANLAYTLEMERFNTKMAGADGPKPVTLRVTTVFRPEGDSWKIVHRHLGCSSAPIGRPDTFSA